ncbi:interleukin-12 receptor subunit beta-2 [Lithobates pipiens]
MEKHVFIYWTAFNITLLCRFINAYSEICGYAHMEIRPSNVTHVGSSVTITCTQKSNGKQGVKIVAGVKRWQNLHGNSITITHTSFNPGRIPYNCNNAADKLICGADIYFGFPPDQPRIISCEQQGESGNVSCWWELKRHSGLPNSCTLQLQMRPNKITESVLESCQTGTNLLTLPVSANPGGEYTALVVTSNPLGKNTSQFYNFTFYDIVKPHPPTNITINCLQTSDECSVTIHPDGDIQHIRLRYQASNEGDWQEVESSINRSFTFYHLHPMTHYHLQAACKYRYGQGIWSDWSQLVTWETPESRPRGKLEVWYKLCKITEKTWTVTLYWKSLNAAEVRGHIRFYQVVFQRVDQSSPASIHNTTDTWFSKDIEADEYVIAVSAHNSKGNSTPTLSRVTGRDLSGLPLPINVIAATDGASNSVTLTWDLPAGNEDLGWDQIVEWEDPTEDKLNHTNWVKVPKFEQKVTLSGHYKPFICYQFRVYFLQEGRVGVPGMTMASTQEKAPEAALEIDVNVKKEGHILVTWSEIPPEKQMGCIRHYSIYLKDRTSSLTKEVKILYNQSQNNQYEIEKGSMNGKYVLWMTYSNGAGETTTRQEIYFTVDVPQDEYVIVYAFLAALILASFLFLLLRVKQRLLMLLSKILPNVCTKAVPDPANCEWAKECISNKNKLMSFPSYASSTSDCDEAETLEIEVLSSEEEFHYCPTYTINPLQTVNQQEKDVHLQEDAEILQPSLHQAEQNLYKSIDFQPAGEMKVQTSDYLVNHVITVDYLPKNILTVYKDKSEEDLFHSQFHLPSWVMASGTIKLDTVRLDFS